MTVPEQNARRHRLTCHRLWIGSERGIREVLNRSTSHPRKSYIPLSPSFSSLGPKSAQGTLSWLSKFDAFDACAFTSRSAQRHVSFRAGHELLLPPPESGFTCNTTPTTPPMTPAHDESAPHTTNQTEKRVYIFLTSRVPAGELREEAQLLLSCQDLPRVLEEISQEDKEGLIDKLNQARYLDYRSSTPVTFSCFS